MGHVPAQKPAGNRVKSRRAGGGRAGTTRISLAGEARLPKALAPRKRPGQGRSRDTVDVILRAAVELFAVRGYARTSTNHVAARAGVSVGSLYQYFPNKDAILTALLEQHLQAVDTVIRASVAELADTAVPLGVGVRHLLERLQALHDHDPGLARAVEAQVGQMPRIPAAFRERERTYIDDLERILRQRPDVRPGNRALMAHLLFQVAETVTAWLAHGGASAFDRGDAIAEATAVLCRYIAGPTRSA